MKVGESCGGVVIVSVSGMIEEGAVVSVDDDDADDGDDDDDDDKENEEEGAGKVGTASLTPSMGTSTGGASVDSREIGTGTNELGVTGQVSNVLERG
jgi:hypothetical protein